MEIAEIKDTATIGKLARINNENTWGTITLTDTRGVTLNFNDGRPPELWEWEELYEIKDA